MIKIIKVYAHLVRIDDLIIKLLWIGLSSKQNLLITIFQARRTSYARAQLQHTSVVAFKFVCISRHIRTRTNKTHIPNEHIPQLGKFIELIST